tara:strand:- start:632 stop:982 length:351 start_codon:yes stop_codon:yes gene_type:complete
MLFDKIRVVLHVQEMLNATLELFVCMNIWIYRHILALHNELDGRVKRSTYICKEEEISGSKCKYLVAMPEVNSSWISCTVLGVDDHHCKPARNPGEKFEESLWCRRTNGVNLNSEE